MNWRKRTAAEIDEAVDKKDYTGGYEFWPWLIYMRWSYLVGFFGNLLLGWGAFISMDSEDRDWVAYAVLGFFGIFAPTLIGYMLRRDYNMLKQGQSS